MNTERIELLKMKVEILKLKSNAYEWQCHTPQDVKDQLEQTLGEINARLTENTTTGDK
jgi:FtsZ-binding cell division protein ZapB